MKSSDPIMRKLVIALATLILVCVGFISVQGFGAEQSPSFEATSDKNFSFRAPLYYPVSFSHIFNLTATSRNFTGDYTKIDSSTTGLSNLSNLTYFGSSVAVDSSRILVGGPGYNGSRGALYIFNSTGGFIRKIDNSTSGINLSADDRFGSSVAVSGSRIYVGARGDNSSRGALYVFNSTGGFIRKIGNSTSGINLSADDRFGSSVAVDSSRIYIGASGADGEGVLYIFNSTTDEFITKIDSNTSGINLSAGGNFGSSVAVSGSRIYVGARGDDSNKGALYVFNSTGGFIRKIDNSTLGVTLPNGSNFGSSIAVSGSRIYVGARGDDSNKGAVYILDSTTGRFITKINDDTPGISFSSDENFGSSVAVYGSKIYIGASRGDNTKGALYIDVPLPISLDISQVSGEAVLIEDHSKIDNSTLGTIANTTNGFSSSVAIHGSRIYVGAEVETRDDIIEGALYILDSTTGGVITKIDGNTSGINLSAGGNFGSSVAVDGSKIYVGASDDGDGAVYVFNNTGEFITKINSSTPGMNNSTTISFGSSVAVDGSNLYVGDSTNNTAYILKDGDGDGRYDGASDSVTRINGSSGTGFGSSIAVSGSRIYVGAQLEGGKGALHIFNSTGGFITKIYDNTSGITLSDGGNFGSSIAVSGSRIYVGARRDGSDEGALYILEDRNGDGDYDGARENKKIDSSALAMAGITLSANDSFGSSVAVSGSKLYVGATGEGRGTLYVLDILYIEGFKLESTTTQDIIDLSFGTTPITLLPNSPNSNENASVQVSLDISGYNSFLNQTFTGEFSFNRINSDEQQRINISFESYLLEFSKNIENIYLNTTRKRQGEFSFELTNRWNRSVKFDFGSPKINGTDIIFSPNPSTTPIPRGLTQTFTGRFQLNFNDTPLEETYNELVDIPIVTEEGVAERGSDRQREVIYLNVSATEPFTTSTSQITLEEKRFKEISQTFNVTNTASEPIVLRLSDPLLKDTSTGNSFRASVEPETIRLQEGETAEVNFTPRTDVGGVFEGTLNITDDVGISKSINVSVNIREVSFSVTPTEIDLTTFQKINKTSQVTIENTGTEELTIHIQASNLSAEGLENITTNASDSSIILQSGENRSISFTYDVGLQLGNLTGDIKLLMTDNVIINGINYSENHTIPVNLEVRRRFDVTESLDLRTVRELSDSAEIDVKNNLDEEINIRLENLTLFKLFDFINSITDSADSFLEGVEDIVVKDNIMFVSSSSEGGEVRMFDISDLNNVIYLHSITDSSQTELGSPTQMFLEGDLLIVVSESRNAIQVLNISNNTFEPQGSIRDNSSLLLEGINGVDVVGDVIYTGSDEGVQLINITDMSPISNFQSDASVKDITLAEGFLYTLINGENNSGSLVEFIVPINISNLTSLSRQNNSDLSGGISIAANEDMVYAATTNELLIYEISNAGNLNITIRVNLSFTPNKILFNENIIYMTSSEGNGSVYTFDVSGVVNPISSIVKNESPSFMIGGASCIDVRDDIVFICGREDSAIQIMRSAKSSDLATIQLSPSINDFNLLGGRSQEITFNYLTHEQVGTYTGDIIVKDSTDDTLRKVLKVSLKVLDTFELSQHNLERQLTQLRGETVTIDITNIGGISRNLRILPTSLRSETSQIPITLNTTEITNLGVNETQGFDITYTAGTEPGIYTGKVIVQDSENNDIVDEVSISLQVLEAFSVSNTNIDVELTESYRGETQKSINLTNTANVPIVLNISSPITLTSQDDSSIEVESEVNETQVTLNPSETKEISLTLPTEQTGIFRGIFRIYDAAYPSLSKSINVSLSVLESFSVSSESEYFNASSESFKLQESLLVRNIDTSLTIENTGNEDLNLTLLSTNLTNGNSTIQLNLSETSLIISSGESNTIYMTYMTGEESGNFSGDIIIQDIGHGINKSISVSLEVLESFIVSEEVLRTSITETKSGSFEFVLTNPSKLVSIALDIISEDLRSPTNASIPITHISRVQLSPQSSENVTLHYTTLREAGNFTGSVTIINSNFPDGELNKDIDIEVFVTSRRLNISQQTFDLDITETRSGDGTFTVTNVGDEVLNFDITTSNFTRGNDIIPITLNTTSLDNLAPQEQREISFNYSASRVGGLFRGEITISDREGVANEVINLSLRVKKRTFSVDRDNFQFEIIEKQQGSGELTITNTGDEDLNLVLTPHNLSQEGKSDIELVLSNTSISNLPIGDSITIDFSYEVVEEGGVFEGHILISDVQNIAPQIRVNISSDVKLRDFSVSEKNFNLELPKMRSGSVTFNITNTADEPLNLTLTHTDLTSGDSSLAIVLNTTEIVDLGPGESESVSISYSSSMTEGIFTGSIFIQDTQDPELNATVNLELNVLSVFGVSQEAIVSQVTKQTSGNFTFTLQNLANVNLTLLLTPRDFKLTDFQDISMFIDGKQGVSEINLSIDEQREVVVSYAAGNESGLFNGEIFIVDSHNSNLQQIVGITLNVTERSFSVLDEVNLQTTQTQEGSSTLTITNTGDEALNLSLEKEDFRSGTNTIEMIIDKSRIINLSAGKSENITINYTAGQQGEEFTGSIRIRDERGYIPEKTVRIILDVTTRDFTITPATLNLKSTEGQQGSKEFTLINRGDEELILNLTDLTLSKGNDTIEISFDKSQVTLTPRGSEVVNLSYTAKNVSGTFTGSFDISDVRGVAQTQSVDVSLNVTHRRFEVSSDRLNVATPQRQADSTEFTITNTGDEELELELTSSNLEKGDNIIATTLDKTNISLRSGEQVKINLSYTTQSQEGVFRGSITIRDKKRIAQTKEISVILDVTERSFSVSEEQIRAEVTKTQTGSLSFNITNIGDEELNLTLTPSDLTSGAHTITPTLDTTRITNLASGQSREVTMSYTAGGNTGTFTGSVVISSIRDTSVRKEVGISLHVKERSFEVSDETLSLSVTKTRQGRATFTLRNTGEEEIALRLASTDLRASGDVISTTLNTTNVTLGVGEQEQVELSFTAGQQYATFTGSITIEDKSGIAPSKTINVVLDVTDKSFTTIPNSLNLQVVEGQSGEAEVTIINTGDADSTFTLTSSDLVKRKSLFGGVIVTREIGTTLDRRQINLSPGSSGKVKLTYSVEEGKISVFNESVVVFNGSLVISDSLSSKTIHISLSVRERDPERNFTTSQDSLNLRITEKQSGKARLTISNTGEADINLSITSESLVQGNHSIGTIIDKRTLSLTSGSSENITLSFTAGDKGGVFRGRITIRSSSQTTKTIPVSLTVDKRTFSVSEESLNLQVSKSRNKTAQLTITNTGDEILNLSLTPSTLTKDTHTITPTQDKLEVILNPREEKNVEISYRAQENLGTFTGEIIIEDTKNISSSKRIRVSLNVTTKGFSVSTNRLEANAKRGSIRNSTITLTNTGSEIVSLVLNPVTLNNGEDTINLSFDKTRITNLGIGESENITIFYNTSSLQGTFRGTLLISTLSDASINERIDIILDIESILFSVSPSNLNLQVIEGQRGEAELEITNRGDSNTTITLNASNLVQGSNTITTQLNKRILNLAPGSSGKVKLIYRAQNQLGLFRGNISLSDSLNHKVVDVSLNVSANETPKAQTFRISKTTLDLEVIEEEKGSGVFSITNTGQVELNLTLTSQPFVSAARDTIQTSLSTSNLVLGVDETKQVHINYTAGDKRGSFVSSIAVVNPKTSSVQTIYLYLNVVSRGKRLTLVPSPTNDTEISTINFIIDEKGDSERSYFYIKNIGGTDLENLNVRVEIHERDDFDEDDFEIDDERVSRFDLEDLDIDAVSSQIELEYISQDDIKAGEYRGSFEVYSSSKTYLSVPIYVTINPDEQDARINDDAEDVEDGVLKFRVEPGDSQRLSLEIENLGIDRLTDLSIRLDDDLEEENTIANLSINSIAFSPSSSISVSDDGGSREVKVRVNVPDNQQAGVYHGRIELLDSEGDRLDEIEIEVKVIGDVYIDSITLNGETSSIDIKPGDTIDVEVVVVNEGSRRIDDVQLEAQIRNIDDRSALREEEENLIISGQDTLIREFSFEIPSGARDAAYEVEVTLRYDGNTITERQAFNVERDEHNVIINTFGVDPRISRCRTSVSTFFSIENIGKRDEEVELKATIRTGDTTLSNSIQVDIDKFGERFRSVDLDISDLQAGTYTVEQSIKYSGITKTEESILSVLECEEATIEIRQEDGDEVIIREVPSTSTTQEDTSFYGKTLSFMEKIGETIVSTISSFI